MFWCVLMEWWILWVQNYLYSGLSFGFRNPKSEIQIYIHYISKVWGQYISFFLFSLFVCLSVSFLLNCFKLKQNPTWIYTPLAIMTKQNLDLSQLYKFIKKETLKKLHCTSLRTLCFDTWNLAQEHSSFTGSSLRCFYTLTGVNLWQIQLIGHDLERHTHKSIWSLTAEMDVRAKTKPWGQRNGLQSWETGLCWDRSGEDYKKNSAVFKVHRSIWPP